MSRPDCLSCLHYLKVPIQYGTRRAGLANAPDDHWIVSDDAEREHGFGDAVKAGNISAHDVITRVAVFLGRL